MTTEYLLEEMAKEKQRNKGFEMSQSPPLNAGQTLEDQQSIHNHNINSINRAISMIGGKIEDSSVSYYDSMQATQKAASDYILYGSDENYRKAVDLTKKFMTEYQAWLKEAKKPKPLTNQLKG